MLLCISHCQSFLSKVVAETVEVLWISWTYCALQITLKGKMGLITNKLIVTYLLYALDIIILILNIPKPKFVDLLSFNFWFYSIFFLFCISTVTFYCIPWMVIFKILFIQCRMICYQFYSNYCCSLHFLWYSLDIYLMILISSYFCYVTESYRLLLAITINY